MAIERDLGTCRARKGLLFLHDCGEPAVARCERCARPVCGMHQVMAQNAVCCPECAAALEDADPEAAGGDPAVDAVRRRRAYYSDYDYHPWYYGRHSYFSDKDYRVFDEKDHVRHEPPGDEGEGKPDGGGDFEPDEGGDSGPDDDLDDAMES
jgi:hypothetical protein